MEKEYIELGVSGYKVSAAERDAIQEIKKDAENGTFDVFLVFMFDRIGRRDDETPFVIQWLVEMGVEVWSTQEGQQCFNHHYDKLINYLRFWFFSGESEKLSIRTKHGSAQTVREGHFRGGNSPYGYRLEKQGRINKRGHEVHDLVVDEYQAAQVSYIFSCCVNQQMSANNIASYLNQLSISHPSGSWHPSTVANILKNPTYMGTLRSGEAQSDVLDHLQIISPVVFERAQNFISQRKDISVIHQTTKTGKNPFLTGMLYCGHCGGRLVASSSGKIIHNKDGTIRRKKRETYVCYNKSRKRLLCTGQTSYTRHYIEDIVEHEILSLLRKLKGSPVDVLKNEFENQVIGRLVRQRTDFEKLIRKSTSDISKLKIEYMKALSNKSNLEKQHIMGMILSTERDASH